MEELVSRDEVARLIGCHWLTVHRMERDGRCPPRVGLAFGKVRFLRSDIERWFANRLRPWSEIVAGDAQKGQQAEEEAGNACKGSK